MEYFNEFFLYIICFISFCYSCPRQYYHITATNSFTFSTDKFQTNEVGDEHKQCEIQISGSGEILVAVTTSLVFSHRQPKNSLEISISTANRYFTVRREPLVGFQVENAFRKVSLPITIKIPMNLNFRSTITVSAIVVCSSNSTYCTEVCDEDCENAVCISRAHRCNGVKNCNSDEDGCGTLTNELGPPHSVYFVEYSSFSSSMAMLIGFLALNGVFIVFFVVLSLCSASSFLSRIVFRARNRKTRTTFLQMIRNAEPEQIAVNGKLNTTNNKGHRSKESVFLRSPSVSPREHRQSLLARLSLQPILREQEPEAEDGPSGFLASLPSPSSVPGRKISMPELNPVMPRLMLKRTSLQPTMACTSTGFRHGFIPRRGRLRSKERNRIV